jgi:hypothetical protein
MEFGKTDAVDEASGLLSACSQRGECLIYTAQGDIIGRCVFMLHEIRACCKRGMCVCAQACWTRLCFHATSVFGMNA